LESGKLEQRLRKPNEVEWEPSVSEQKGGESSVGGEHDDDYGGDAIQNNYTRGN
jgi:hypothetical protein